MTSYIWYLYQKRSKLKSLGSLEKEHGQWREGDGATQTRPKWNQELGKLKGKNKKKPSCQNKKKRVEKIINKRFIPDRDANLKKIDLLSFWSFNVYFVPFFFNFDMILLFSIVHYWFPFLYVQKNWVLAGLFISQ